MNDKEFETLLSLAYLDVADDERESLRADIDSILKYVEQLQDVDLPRDMYKRDVVEAIGYRSDKVCGATTKEFELVKKNFHATTDDGLVEAHGVLGHK